MWRLYQVRCNKTGKCSLDSRLKAGQLSTLAGTSRHDGELPHTYALCIRPLYVSVFVPIVHQHVYVSGLVRERRVMSKVVSSISARYRELY